MCRSAPPRISTIERLENPDVDQESILPFEIHAGALWTVAENWADLAQIESDPEWSPSVLDDQEDFGLRGPDDDTSFFSNDFEQDARAQAGCATRLGRPSAPCLRCTTFTAQPSQ